MKGSELRIGNLILWARGSVKVSAILESGLIRIEGNSSFFGVEGSEPCLLPIPLTEEWCSRTKFHVDITENIIIWTDGDKVFMEQYGEGVEEVKNMGYVHLRQNLYHALTGEELTINED